MLTNKPPIDKDILRERFFNAETKGKKEPYTAINKVTGAVGRYQFIPKYFPDFNVEEALKSPQYQEKYFDKHLDTLYVDAEDLKSKYKTNLSAEDLMFLIHFKGKTGTSRLLKDPSLMDKGTENNPSPNEYLKRSQITPKNTISNTKSNIKPNTAIVPPVNDNYPVNTKYQVVGVDAVGGTRGNSSSYTSQNIPKGELGLNLGSREAISDSPDLTRTSKATAATDSPFSISPSLYATAGNIAGEIVEEAVPDKKLGNKTFKRKGETIGSNTLKGAGIGAAVGSVIPVIGTGVGAVVGAGVGAVTGLISGNKQQREYEKEIHRRNKSLLTTYEQPNYGESIPQFKQGGYIDKLENNDLIQYNSPSHSEGGQTIDSSGIPVEGQYAAAEIEKNENMQGNFVFSDTLGVDKFGNYTLKKPVKTFAQMAKKIDKKYKDRKDKLSITTKEFEFNLLKEKNEEAMQEKAFQSLSRFEKKYGGIVKLNSGGHPPIANLPSYNPYGANAPQHFLNMLNPSSYNNNERKEDTDNNPQNPPQETKDTLGTLYALAGPATNFLYGLKRDNNTYYKNAREAESENIIRNLPEELNIQAALNENERQIAAANRNTDIRTPSISSAIRANNLGIGLNAANTLYQNKFNQEVAMKADKYTKLATLVDSHGATNRAEKIALEDKNLANKARRQDIQREAINTAFGNLMTRRNEKASLEATNLLFKWGYVDNKGIYHVTNKNGVPVQIQNLDGVQIGNTKSD